MQKVGFYIILYLYTFLGELRYFSLKYVVEFELLFGKSNFSNLKLLENKQIESSQCFAKRIIDEANIWGMKTIADIIHKISQS